MVSNKLDDHRENVENSESLYDPDNFGLNRETVYDFRQRLFASEDNIALGLIDEPDGLPFFAWRKKDDSTNLENGQQYFANLMKNNKYSQSMGEHTKKLFEKHSDIAKHIGSQKNLVEYGGGLGEGNKVKKRLYDPYLSKNNKQYTHVVADISGVITEGIRNEYEAKDENIRGEGVIGDRFDSELLREIPDKALIMIGGTIGNYPKHKRVELLRSMNSRKRLTRSPILLNYKLAPFGEKRKEGIEEALEAYSNEENKIFVFKGLQALGFDITQLEFHVRYKESDEYDVDKIQSGAKVLEDIEIEIKKGQRITIKAGSYLWPISSRYFPEGSLEVDAEEANCKVNKSWGNEKMVILGLETFKTSIPSKIKYISGAILLALASVTAGVAIGSYIEKSKQKEKQEESIKKALMSVTVDSYGGYFDGAQSKNFLEQTMEERIQMIEVRYNRGRKLSEHQRKKIVGLYVMYLKRENPNLRQRMGSQGMLYDHKIVSPTDLERFVFDSQLQLEDLGISTRPNQHILEHIGAVRNSYFYKGDRQVFNSPDIVLDNFISHQSGTAHGDDIKAFYSEYECGIVSFEGVDYFVVKDIGQDTYTLRSNIGLTDHVSDIEYSLHKQTHELLQGNAKLLAEQIRILIYKKYSDESYDTANRVSGGQATILRYLIELYAMGYDLDYLIGKNYHKYSNERPSLELFVRDYVIPDIGDELLNPTASRNSAMNEVDFDKEEENYQLRKCSNVKKLTERIVDRIGCYSDGVGGLYQEELSGRVLEKVLYDRAASYIEDEWDIRCWLSENQQYFQDLGIQYHTFSSKLPFDTFSNDRETTLSNNSELIGKPYGRDYINEQVYEMIDGRKISLLRFRDDDGNYFIGGRVQLFGEKRYDSDPLNSIQRTSDKTVQLTNRYAPEFTSSIAKQVYEDIQICSEAMSRYQDKKK